MNGLSRALDRLPELAPPPDDASDSAPLGPEARRARLLASAAWSFRPPCFSGGEFPALACDSLEVHEAIGPHDIRVTFYDRDYNVVTAPTEPGRYGAVIDIVPRQGRPMRRLRTLFCQPEPFAWWRTYVPASIELPPQMGIAPPVAQAHRHEIGAYLKDQFARGLSHDPGGAILLAGLFESDPDSSEPPFHEDAWARDRQWWVGLKRRLDGTASEFPEPFVAPRHEAGLRAPTLRDGSAGEAGMEARVVERLDDLLSEWARASDEAFAVCVARRGVAFFERAYGTRGGQPITPQDGSWMASITKLLAGSLLMMLADQGRVSLDEPVHKYLPALRGVEVREPLTLRHLMSHTSGLWGHLGDEMHDWEHIVAGLYPHLEVGRRYLYNGAGNALAGKVIEAVSGEALPQFFRSHLLAPLGMSRTEVGTMSWDTWSTARDIAAFGQMLLNRGAYGDRRFFSPATFAGMLPRPVREATGADSDEEYGIGSSWFQGEGLGEGTFGHGAASSATLRIDPRNEMVVMMARNDAGASFHEFHPRFLRLLGESVV